jgi:hypothetical protein
VTPDVAAAVEEIRASYAGHRVEATPEGQGGAYVIVHDLEFGDHYTPSSGWMGFLIDFQYPSSYVYPHFIDADVKRTDGQAHGESFSGPTLWPGRPEKQAWQVSRRSYRWNPAFDTAANKLEKVLEWIRSR